jgi:hypothetical protein
VCPLEFSGCRANETFHVKGTTNQRGHTFAHTFSAYNRLHCPISLHLQNTSSKTKITADLKTASRTFSLAQGPPRCDHMGWRAVKQVLGFLEPYLLCSTVGHSCVLIQENRTSSYHLPNAQAGALNTVLSHSFKVHFSHQALLIPLQKYLLSLPTSHLHWGHLGPAYTHSKALMDFPPAVSPLWWNHHWAA